MGFGEEHTHLIHSLLLQFPVVLQRLGHMIQGTVKQPQGFRPFLHGGVGLGEVKAAKGLESESTSGIF